MAWVDDVGYVEDQPAAPASYEEQVAMARSWGVPENEIASIVGTPESVAANNAAQAEAIYELTGQTPAWAQDVGYVAPPPSWLNPADYVSSGYDAPYTQAEILSKVDPSWIREMAGQVYASVKGPGDLSGGEYLVDPNTGKFVLDASGNPIGVAYPKSSGFDDFMTTPQGFLTAAALIGSGGLALNALPAAGALGTVAGSAGEGLLANPLIAASLKGAGYGALTGGVTSALTGQDALKGALIGGATGGILGGGEAALFPEAANWAAGSVTNSGLLGAGRGAVGGALNTLIGGGDLKQNVLYGGLSGGAIGAGSEYFFPSTPTSTSPAANADTTAPEFAGATTPKPQQVVGGDMTQEIANMNLMNEYERAYGLNRASNYEMADWVTRLNEIPLEQQRIALIDEGWDPAAVEVATMPKSEIESYLNKNTIDGASGIEAYDRARAIEMKYGTTIGEAGEAGINMPLYTDTPLDQQYINQDLQEGYASAYREPAYRPSNWFSGLGNLGTMLGMGALGKLGGGAGGAKPMAGASGSYVPKGMVDYSGILNLLAPKTSTRSSLLG